jgi:DNA-binding transcriptional MerR regulator
MKVKEVAELTGVSVRTLHHYDEIGLLKPEEVTESGYRIYSAANLETLQQILFFRELGFSLMKIKEIVTDPDYDRNEALAFQRRMLVDKRGQLDRMIAVIDQTIRHHKGEIHMTDKEKFAGFDFTQGNPYEAEARQRWGDKAVDGSKGPWSAVSKEEQEKLGQEMNGIYFKLADLRHLSPESDEAQNAIKLWWEYLNRMGSYSPEAFKGLGLMYVNEERFTKNIDKFGEGLALFMRDAMAVFADRAAAE